MVANLTAEHIHDPLELVLEELRKSNNNALIAFGERHDDNGTLFYESMFVLGLHEAGLNIGTVFLEEDVVMNGHLASYYRTGIMPTVLHDYLRRGGFRSYFGEQDYKLKLVMLCNSLTIPVFFIDDRKIFDRDRDWEMKLREAIGNEISGLHILIAGRNHASHSSNIYVNGGSTVVDLLDTKYPQRVLSINCQVNKRRSYHAGDIERKFADDLRSLERLHQASAVKVEDSPYENMQLRNFAKKQLRRFSPKSLTVGEAFDLLICVPENLKK